MNNFHIYEEIGKGKYSTVYKVMINCLKETVLRQVRDKWSTDAFRSLIRVTIKIQLLQHLKSIKRNSKKSQ